MAADETEVGSHVSDVGCRVTDLECQMLSDIERRILKVGCHKVPESFLTYHRLFEQNP